MTAVSSRPTDVPARKRLWREFRQGAVAVAALAAGGAVLSLGTSRIREAELAAGLQLEAPEIDRGDALSQQLAVFMLGGLRSLAAELLALDATDAWLCSDWDRAERRWNSVTTLAPRRVNYWVSASRDMGVNAESSVRHDDRRDRVERATLSKRYFERGVRFLQDGISNNPDSALLHCRLGDLLSDLYRRPRFAEAADAYHRAVELGATPLYQRMEFYNLCRVRGREKEAYALGRKLFLDERNQVPSLLCLLFVLQNRMGLPADECLGIQQLFGSEEDAREYLEAFRYNTNVFPTDGVAAYLDRHK